MITLILLRIKKKKVFYTSSSVPAALHRYHFVHCNLRKTKFQIYIVRINKWWNVLRLQNEDTSIFQVILALTTYYSDEIWRGSNHSAVLFYATEQLLNQKRLPEEKIIPSKAMLCKMVLWWFFFLIREWYINDVLWLSCNWNFSSFVKLTVFKLENFDIRRQIGKLKIKGLTFKTNLKLVPTLH